MAEAVESYPLAWPQTHPRSKRRKPASFQTSLGTARDALMKELRLMHAKNVVLSSNLELRRDGLPYANQRQPSDPGVAVYFEWQGDSYAFACDQWTKVEDNLQAIRKTVEAIRGIARWGTGEMVRAAFTGFKALPQTGSGWAWWEVLGVAKDAPRELVDRAYRIAAQTAHPDKPTGSRADWDRLQEAYRQAKAATP